jgi:hypothetical protein
MHPPPPLTFMVVAVACAVAAGCARRPLPAVHGSLAGVVVDASFAGELAGADARPLLLDSASFARLGVVSRGTAFTAAELRAQIGRPFEPVDARTVLECPDRMPCHVRGDAGYLEVWHAERRGAAVELVVSRVFNVQGLHRMTRSVTHRMTVAPQPGAGGWRLTARERLPD